MFLATRISLLQLSPDFRKWIKWIKIQIAHVNNFSATNKQEPCDRSINPEHRRKKPIQDAINFDMRIGGIDSARNSSFRTSDHTRNLTSSIQNIDYLSE
jgi:hypothetical protein